MKASEIRELSNAELNEKLTALKAELFKLLRQRYYLRLVRILDGEHYSALLEYLEACRYKSLVESFLKCLCYTECLAG